jgi:hypothetical protein
MKKLLTKNSLLLASVLVLAAGLCGIYFYLARERKEFSLEIVKSENRFMLLTIFACGTIGLGLNLGSAYKVFIEKLKIISFLRLIFLNFPLLFIQTLLVYAWFVLNGFF